MLGCLSCLQIQKEGPIIWYQSMETRSQVAGKRMETRVEKLEDKMGLVQTELLKVVTRLESLDKLD